MTIGIVANANIFFLLILTTTVSFASVNQAE
jgi:hypothetical protein